MICLFLVPALVAAIWAWRMAEASLERAKMDGHIEFLRANKAAKEYMTIKDELNLLKINRVNENNMHDAEVKELRARFDIDLTKLHQGRDEITRRLSRLNDININLKNEIDGLNVDKLYLKGKLAEFEAKQAKRREQKAAAMRRFRAKNKEAKNTTKK